MSFRLARPFRRASTIAWRYTGFALSHAINIVLPRQAILKRSYSAIPCRIFLPFKYVISSKDFFGVACIIPKLINNRYILGELNLYITWEQKLNTRFSLLAK